jgi:hypothetical protein
MDWMSVSESEFAAHGQGLWNVRDEETDNGTNIEHVHQETQPVALLHLGGEKLGPVVHHLRSIDKHAMIEDG